MSGGLSLLRFGLRGKGPKAVGNWLDDSIRALRKGLDHPATEERIARIAARLPQVTEAYAPEAVAHAARYAPEGQLIAATPRQFLSFAAPLDRTYAPGVANKDWLKAMVERGEFVDPSPEVGFFPEYVDSMRGRPYRGLEDVPYLSFKPSGDVLGTPRVKTYEHEGRHRNWALGELYGEDTPFLVRVNNGQLPAGDRVRVIPEGETQSVVFEPTRYAQGGLAAMRQGGH